MPQNIKFKTTNEPTTCPLCGITIWAKKLVIIDQQDKHITLCPKCYSLINTCTTCEHGLNCGFHSDHSEPQYINKTIRQNGVILQTQIKNPRLIEKHCSNCRCSTTITMNDVFCHQEQKGINCPNYIILSKLLQ